MAVVVEVVIVEVEVEVVVTEFVEVVMIFGIEYGWSNPSTRP